MRRHRDCVKIRAVRFVQREPQHVMAKRRRRRGEPSKKQADEKSRSFMYLLIGIGVLLLLGFIALRMM